MEEKAKKPIKGIKIRSMNVKMIILSCVLYIILLLATVNAARQYRAMVSNTEDYIACEQDASLVREGSDYLTEQVRLYTVTRDPQYMEAYFTEVYTTRRRDTALENMQAFGVSDSALAYLQAAHENSNKLMEQEIYAMRLTAEAQKTGEAELAEDVRNMALTARDAELSPEEMIAKAQDMVFGTSYQEAKESIMSNISRFIDSIMGDTMGKQQDSAEALKDTMTRQQILISILFAENIMTFILISILVVKPLDIYIENIGEKERLQITGSYEFKYLALTYNNIYELNANNEAMLSYRAEHDALTGIINRGAFDRLRQILKTKQAPIALLIIDVDKFKQVNDGYGHETGDKVLKKVAKLLEESFRSSDYAARIGGDEFAVIVTEAAPEMKSAIVKKISGINEKLMNPSDGLPKVSLSVGGAFSPNGFEDTLYKNADKALYQVKENGRCGCRFYEELQEAASAEG